LRALALRYHFNDVIPGKTSQYEINDVTELLRLGGLGLPTEVVHFDVFVNLRASAGASRARTRTRPLTRKLQRLNLAGNKITDLTRIGLEALHELYWLDVRNNRIATAADTLGPLLNGATAHIAPGPAPEWSRCAAVQGWRSCKWLRCAATRACARRATVSS
jgi:hypothetical protein